MASSGDATGISGTEGSHGSDRDRRLLDAALVLTAEHSTAVVLQRIVELAADLTGARYAALGIIGPESGLSDFLTTGLSAEERAAIGPLPKGHGILGVLIADPRPLRLGDIRADQRSVGFPANHPPMRTFLGAPVRSRGTVFGNLYLTEKADGREFTAEDEETILLLAAQAGIAIENARLVEAAAERERRLEALYGISRAVLASERSDEVLDLVAERARELVGAAIAMIALPDLEPGVLRIAAASGANAAALRDARFPTVGSLSGEVMLGGAPVVLENALADPRVHVPLFRAAGAGPAMFLPLVGGDRAFGTLTVANERGGRLFDDDDLRRADGFAQQASLVLAYGRTQEQLRRVAVLEDRERIGRDLHDGVIQALFAAGMSLQALGGIVDEPQVADRIGAVVEQLDRVIRELRSYIFGLRPDMAARRLDDTLRRLVSEFEERTGVATVVTIDRDAVDMLTPRETDVVQVVREALSNVGRHSGAATCRVTVVPHDRGVLLEVNDDGRGFDNTQVRPGMGLQNLGERARAIGGELTVDSTAGEGTAVRIVFPID